MRPRPALSITSPRCPSDANGGRRRTCARRQAPVRQTRGMVLFIVLVVVAMVSLAGFSFCALMSTENKAAHLQGDQLQLEQAVASGVEFVKALVAQPRPAAARRI